MGVPKSRSIDPLLIQLRVLQTATALGKLGHPDGELNLTRAAGKKGVIQMVSLELPSTVHQLICTPPPQIPTLSSCSFDELVDAALPDQVQFLQLYVNRDREVTRKIIERAEQRGIKGLFITVDAPQLGRREKDMRTKFEDEGASVQKNSEEQVDRSQGAAKAITVGGHSDAVWFLTRLLLRIVVH